MPINKQCKYCEQTFITYPSRSRIYCSRKCYNKDHRVTIVCNHCNKEFEVIKHKAKQQYCSDICRREAEKPLKKVCPICNKIFKRQKKSQRYCSNKCVGISQRSSTLICEYCGKEYIRGGKVARKQARYCSRECRNASGKQISICQYCGKHIKLKASLAKSRKYCSQECFGKAQRKRAIVTCPICKVDFEVKSSQVKQGKAKYCSKKCADIGRSIEFSGPNHCSWQSIKCICQTCGKTFHCKPSELEKGYGKHCSMECRKLERVECICEFCEKSFYRLPSQIENGTKRNKGYGRFCSMSCRSKYAVRQLHITSPTSIEQALLDELDHRKIEYEFQYPLRDWVFDFAFPSSKLVVEVDGVYWHSLPHVIERDARKDADLQSQGWTVLRFTGDEIRESPQGCVDEIVKVLK